MWTFSSPGMKKLCNKQAAAGNSITTITAFNGFAAELSYGQAKKLQSMNGVVAVRPDELLVLDTATTPAFHRVRRYRWFVGLRGVDWEKI